MCGINGFNFKDIDLIKKMSSITSSRGPDNQDYFSTENYTVGHNRLAIIDLDKRSNQPFTDGDLTIIFNGEIYNYLEIKKKLLLKKKVNFKTNSDTEILLKAYKEFGINFFD